MKSHDANPPIPEESYLNELKTAAKAKVENCEMKGALK